MGFAEIVFKMTDDKYIKEKVKPIAEYFVTIDFVNRVSKKWWNGFKEILEDTLNKVYEDGLEDGHNEGLKDSARGEFS